MADSQFLPFQDTDGDLQNDKCNVNIAVEGRVCPTCIPNESALVPDWKTQKEPFLNEKICKYQITYKTKEKSTGYEEGMTEDEARKALADIFEEYKEPAAIELLEAYNREQTIGSIELVRQHLECTDYDLVARANSRLKLLYSIAYDILEGIPQAEEDDEDDPCVEPSLTDVTYKTFDLEEKLLRIRKGLKLYNRYYRIFSATSDGVQRFVFASGDYAGKEFVLQEYGDYGLGINLGDKRAKLDKVYSDLDDFLRKQEKLSLRPGRGFFREPVTKIEMSFNENYKITKLLVYTEKCGIKPFVFTKKLKLLRKTEGWKDRTAVAYFAQLDKMDQDLQARSPKPWKDFIIEYTYPRVDLKGAEAEVGSIQSAGGCVAQAIGDRTFNGSFFDQEFKFTDALLLKWHETYCVEDTTQIETIKKQFNNIIDRSEDARKYRETRRAQKRYNKSALENGTAPVDVDPLINPDGYLMEVYKAAQEQAYGEIQTENDPFALLCIDGFSFDGSLEILTDLKICGLEAALTSAITCLFSGLTLEQALSSVIKSALSAMNIEKFNDLFIGLPAEQRAELDALAQKKLQEGDLFKSDSSNQQLSDAIAGNDFQTLTQIYEEKEAKKEARKQEKEAKKEAKGQESNTETQPEDEAPEETQNQRGKVWLESEQDKKEDPNVQKRTLAERLDNPSGGTKESQLLAAYVAALLEYYADNLLELVDHLNRFPGARLISNALLAIDCPRPPIFNPTVFDFIKDFELPFCRNIDDISFPKLANPFGWLPNIKDLLGALFAALRNLIRELIIAILVKLFLKICDLLGSAACKALSVAGNLAAGLVTDGATGRETLESIFRDAVCGEDASQEDINNAITEMFENFGVGAQAFANQGETLALAESMANTMTQREMADAFLGNMSSEASTIMVDIIDAEYPQFSDALGSEEKISQMFDSMGKLLPLSFRETLNDMAAEMDDSPVNPSLCATPEQLEDFKSARANILEGRASPEQISLLSNAQFNTDDLSDLQSVLDGGLDDYISNNMPPVTSDPGCDNGLLPYEPEETITAVTQGIGGDFEILQIDYTTDMIGNGPTDKNWGMINMMMSDTQGLPLTAHIRKAGINPLYVDQYGSFFPDPTIVKAVAIYDPLSGITLNSLDQSNRAGAYPEKMAAYLQYYMNGQVDTQIISVGYNNVLQDQQTRQIQINNIVTLRKDPTSYRTESYYTYNDQGEVSGIEISSGAKKLNSDIELTFNDNAKGYRQLEESEYEYGFDIDAYTAEFSMETGEDGTFMYHLYSDNMRVKITERINEKAKSYNINSEDPSYDVSVDNNGNVESFEESESSADKNDDLDINSTVLYNFLSVDDTFEEIGDELESYTSFQNSFVTDKEYQPQTYLLRGLISREGQLPFTFEPSVLNEYRSSTTNTILQAMFKQVADVEAEISSWDYGASVETLEQADTEYGINDNGIWVPYKDTGYDNEDMILGISYDQYKNEVSGTLDKTRVFYLDPNDFGGSYKKPGIYIKPPEFKGWFGLIDVLFPDYGPCKPYNTNLVDFDQIKEQIDQLYPNIPEDERLKSDPDCIVELPYNRILERPAKAAMMGLIVAACRIYVSSHMIKTLPTFAQFKPNFPEVYSSAYASYIVEEMQEAFKNVSRLDNSRGFSDEDFWYTFLEQCVQMYSYRIDIGDVEPSTTVLQALERLNDLQSEYEYPTSRKDVEGDIGRFQTLKNYRMQKNIEAIIETQEDAKLVMKEWIIEQIVYMSTKLMDNMEKIGFVPKIKDINYYVLENFVSGAELTLNDNIDSSGNMKATYGSLPTIPFEDNEDASEPYYTTGGELVIEEIRHGERAPENSTIQVGQEYVGFYHVHIEEDGTVVYMVGEYHTDRPHHVLKPISNIMSVPIGDIADFGTITTYDKPFAIEKYISIDGTKYATEKAMELIRAQDQDKLVSEVYPGTMELVTNEQGTPVGITGELGIRYGIKFSVVIDGLPYEITSVEVDALDLTLKDTTTLSANSLKLYCLIKDLAADNRFKMLMRYIIPVNKLTSLTAIYNDMAMLPSIGQLIVKKSSPFDLNIEKKIENTPGVLPETIYTIDSTVNIEDLDIDRPAGAWAHPEDRKDRNGLLILSWDNWDQEVLTNSSRRIKKLFKTYYNARDFLSSEERQTEDGPGKIFEKGLKNIFRPSPGRQLLPWFQKRDLRENPFNSLGELCKKEDT